jgi:hypothetical protein
MPNKTTITATVTNRPLNVVLAFNLLCLSIFEIHGLDNSEIIVYADRSTNNPKNHQPEKAASRHSGISM